MSLPKTTLGLAVGLLLAAGIGWSLGGDRGMGVFLGTLLGAGLAGLSTAWQAHCLRYRPERAAQAQLEGLAAKLGAVAITAVAFRYVEALSQTVSWKTFLLAFAAAVLLVLPFSAFDLSRLIAAARARSRTPQAEDPPVGVALGTRRTS